MKLDGLIVSLRDGGRNYPQTYYLFQPDDRFSEALPAGGLSVAEFQATCQIQPMMGRTFKQPGVNVVLTRNGKTQTMAINAADGGYQIDGSATT